MLVTAKIQIWNNQDHPDAAFIASANPKVGESASIIDIEVGGERYEVLAEELVEAVLRISGQIAK